MDSNENKPVSRVGGNELHISRVFNLSRERVFEAWTDPKQVAVWFGPNGFTNTITEMDVRPGGVWKFTMHGPDGRDYPNKIVFIDVKKPELLVYKHTGDEETEHVKFHVTVSFEDLGGKTRLTMKSVFETAEELDRVEREYGAIEGANQNMERLAEYLSDL